MGVGSCSFQQRGGTRREGIAELLFGGKRSVGGTVGSSTTADGRGKSSSTKQRRLSARSIGDERVFNLTWDAGNNLASLRTSRVERAAVGHLKMMRCRSLTTIPVTWWTISSLHCRGGARCCVFAIRQTLRFPSARIREMLAEQHERAGCIHLKAACEACTRAPRLCFLANERQLSITRLTFSV